MIELKVPAENLVRLTTQDKHKLCCQRVARLDGQTSTGYDWERTVKVSM